MNVIVRKEEIKKEKVVKSLIEVLRYRKYSFENKVKLNIQIKEGEAQIKVKIIIFRIKTQCHKLSCPSD